MKPSSCLFLSVIVVLACRAAVGAEGERAKRPILKGVELYSWQEPGSGWTFALVVGTNRLKTPEEVRDPQNRITGVEALKKRLARLAVGENVSWLHRIDGFEYPPGATIQEIKACAKELRITLRVADPMK
jgi:hypothetical protein